MPADTELGRARFTVAFACEPLRRAVAFSFTTDGVRQEAPGLALSLTRFHPPSPFSFRSPARGSVELDRTHEPADYTAVLSFPRELATGRTRREQVSLSLSLSEGTIRTVSRRSVIGETGVTQLVVGQARGTVPRTRARARLPRGEVGAESALDAPFRRAKIKRGRKERTEEAKRARTRSSQARRLPPRSCNIPRYPTVIYIYISSDSRPVVVYVRSAPRHSEGFK